MASLWYFRKNKTNFGPITSMVFRQFVAAGLITPADLVRKKGFHYWCRAEQVKGLYNRDGSPAVPASIHASGELPDEVDAGLSKSNLTLPANEASDQMHATLRSSGSIKGMSQSSAKLPQPKPATAPPVPPAPAVRPPAPQKPAVPQEMVDPDLADSNEPLAALADSSMDMELPEPNDSGSSARHGKDEIAKLVMEASSRSSPTLRRAANSSSAALRSTAAPKRY